MIRSSLFFKAAFLCIFLGCQTSYIDFREKGRSKSRSLLAELRAIRTKDQLIDHQERLASSFDALNLLAVQVLEYRKQHAEELPPPLTDEDRELNDQLRLEILRVQRLDGGREVLNKCRKKC